VIAVIFEVWPSEGKAEQYFDLAAALKEDLEKIDGFLSVERFQSLTTQGKYMFYRSGVRKKQCAPGGTATAIARPSTRTKRNICRLSDTRSQHIA